MNQNTIAQGVAEGPGVRGGRLRRRRGPPPRGGGRLREGRDLSDVGPTDEGLVVDTLLSDEAKKAGWLLGAMLASAVLIAIIPINCNARSIGLQLCAP